MNSQNNTKNVAVLLMLFARPDTTRAVFEKLREAKPNKIFIAANGPRPDHPEDIASCQAVRDIFNEIDWDCEIYKNYREVNINMHSHWWMAMDWFFESVDRGIILEDDCVPDYSFFDYSINLLEKYKDNESIMHINGTNLQFGKKRGNSSYYFSIYPCVWGWATWKRAWKKYDYNMKTYNKSNSEKTINAIIENKKEKKYWITFFEKAYLMIFKTADVRWTYTIWSNNGLCISPNINLISNIGFGLSAGHTIFKDKTLGQKVGNISNLIHPTSITQDKEADNYVFKNVYNKTFVQKVIYISAMKIIKSLGL